MREERTCWCCGERFIATHPRTKYCKGCHKYVGNGSLADKPQKPNKIFTCEKCGKTFELTSYQAFNWRWGLYGKKYCSKECYMEVFAHCCYCGKQLPKGQKFDYQHIEHQYCSKECMKKDHEEFAIRVGRMSTCVECGKKFPDYFNNRTRCDDCKKTKKKDRI